MSVYVTWQDSARHDLARGLAAGEDTDVQDCLHCDVMWDALRETHHCRAARRPQPEPAA